LQSWLAVAREFGDKLPGPFAAVSGRFVQRVPRSLHAQLIAKAKEEGVSLNTLIVSLVSQGLGLRADPPIAARLSKRPAGRISKTARSLRRVG
jgi:antitoxin HicB